MIHRSAKSILASVAVSVLALTMLPAEAATAETPESFVRRVYARYRSDGPGVPMSRPGSAAFFTPPLVDALERDQAGAGTEGVALDWDPVCDCQAYDLRLKTVTVVKGEAGTMKAQAAFTNLVSRRTVVLTLSQTPQGWRIADLVDKEGTSIIALLRKAYAHTPAKTPPHKAQAQTAKP